MGFPVKVLGNPDLKSHDARRYQSNPELKVTIGYLAAIFDYLAEHDLGMYRMSSDVVPYATHPDLPQFHNQVTESATELAQLGCKSREQNLRLSFHPSQFIVLNSPDAALREKSAWDLQVQASVLDAMELGPEAVMVIHVGGSYGNNESGIDRWCSTWERLTDAVRARLVLEHDDLRYSASDVLRIHERTGVRLIFDVQHFWCLNPEQLPLKPTLERFLKTWPKGVRPKIHFSSPRTEMREITRTDRKSGKKKTVLQPPIWTGHAAYNHPFEFISFMREMKDLEFDLMVEAKAKDLAVLRLRRDLLRYAPDVAIRFGLQGEEISEEAEEEIAVDPAVMAAS